MVNTVTVTEIYICNSCINSHSEKLTFVNIRMFSFGKNFVTGLLSHLYINFCLAHIIWCS